MDAITLARLLGIAVPLLVALVTKKYASNTVKVLANLVMSAALGALVPVLNGNDTSTSVLINSMLNTFALSIVAYYGVFKPTGVAAVVTEKTSAVGIGPSRAPDDAGMVDPAAA
jgi:hypothetical protein